MSAVEKVNETLDLTTEANNSDKIGKGKNNSKGKPKKLPASEKTKLKHLVDVIPRGMPKSGRPWKEPKQKFSTIKKSIYRHSFKKKEQLRQDLKHVKELSNSIKAAKKDEIELRKQRRIENAARQLANQRKSEIVQIIKNPNKLKKMKRKHLRMVEKRDLDKIKVV